MQNSERLKPYESLKLIFLLKMIAIIYGVECFFALTRGLSIAHGAASQMKSVLKSE
jgi:hypothetical protein